MGADFVTISSDCSARPCRDKQSKSQIPDDAMKRLIATAIALVALSGPLYAQGRPAPKSDDPAEQAKIDEARRIEQQYKDTLKRMDKKTEANANDPWANMRGTDNSKTDTKTKP
jgi:hypothetical protein